MKRKTFIRNLSILGGAGLLTGLYTWQIEPFWLEFTKIKMPVRNLPEHLVGKTLMQISDIHIGGVDQPFIINAFREAQALKPDYVVYTGDFVSYRNEEQYGQLAEVFDHAVKGKSATLGVLGNHDYGKNWSESHVAENILEILRKRGVQILRNEKTDIDGLHIIGLDDIWGTNYNPLEVMNQYDPGIAHVALCHNPDVADEPVWNGYQGWILSGHTHGGQCKPPFLPAPMLPVRNKRYSAGEVRLADGRTLYINRALGHLWQVRFNVRPEITIFTLEKQNA